MVLFGCGGEEDFGDDIILHTKWLFPLGVAVPGAGTVNVNGGAGANNALLPGNPQNRLLRHFNVLVAENEMKPDAIMPTSRPTIDYTKGEEGVEYNFAAWKANYRWENADALVEYAEANNQRVRGHTLFWHAQTPQWFFQNNSGELLNLEQLYLHMELHIKTIFERYGNRIDTWDVFNEVILHDNPSGQTGLRRGPNNNIFPVNPDNNFKELSWYTRIIENAGKTGDDRNEFILFAFEKARYWAGVYTEEGDPVQLYLTDFGVERPFYRGEAEPGPNRTSKQQDFYDLARWLVDKNAPIDGIGFQGHFRLYDHPVDGPACLDNCVAPTPCNNDNCVRHIRGGIVKFSYLGLKIQVCELDFSIFSGAKGEGDLDIMPSGNLNQRLNDLADTYLAFFEMFEYFFNEGVLDMVLIWGLADGHSWLNKHPRPNRTDYPLLFDRNYRPKQAYFRLTENR